LCLKSQAKNSRCYAVSKYGNRLYNRIEREQGLKAASDFHNGYLKTLDTMRTPKANSLSKNEKPTSQTGKRQKDVLEKENEAGKDNPEMVETEDGQEDQDRYRDTVQQRQGDIGRDREVTGIDAQQELNPQENVRRGLKALDYSIEFNKDVENAMYRPEYGDISFYYGEAGYGNKFKKGWGISHIIAKHGKGVAREVVNTIAYGKQVNQQVAAGGDRIFLDDGKHTAVLSLYKYGDRKTWLLTGWDNDAPGGLREVYGSNNPTHIEPTRFQPDTGAGSVDTDIIPQTNEKYTPRIGWSHR
jgi:hypothetical protein